MKIALDIDDGLFQNAARLPDSSDQLTVVNAALLT